MQVLEQEKVVEPRKSSAPIDYIKLAEKYNSAQVGQAVQMDKVYNITLFKGCIERRGLKSNEDFQAYNVGDKTYVKRLTESAMTQE